VQVNSDITLNLSKYIAMLSSESLLSVVKDGLSSRVASVLNRLAAGSLFDHDGSLCTLNDQQ